MSNRLVAQSNPLNSDKANILVVDDDRDIRRLLASTLVDRGYHLFTASTACEMDDVLAREHIDLVLLDIMMPGENGLSACRRLFERGGPSVVILSALGSEDDRVRGLDVGAGHYLSKPFGARELVATVRAALRSQGAVAAGKAFLFVGWRMDVDAHELFDPSGVIVSLTDGEFALLRTLAERPRRVLSREQLLEMARGPNTESFDRAIDVQISRIRRKLRSPGDEIIRTVRNEGYLFVPTVRRT